MRKIILILIIVTLLFSMSASAGIVNTTTKFYMPANGTAGTITFTDLSPNGYILNAYGNTQIKQSNGSAKWGNASYFDGTGDLIYGPPNAINFSTSFPWSIAFWMNSSGTAGAYGIVLGNMNKSARGDGEFRFSSVCGSANSFCILTNNGVDVLVSNTSVNPNDGKWHYIVISRTNATTISGWMDGLWRANLTIASTAPVGSSTRNLTIGFQAVDNVYYTGYIDDIVISNGTLIDGTAVPSIEYVDSATVSTPPVASFTASNTTGIYPPSLPVKFTDTSTNTPTSWQWNFTNTTGNNTAVTFSTTQNPLWSFDIGNFSITLKATNADGSDLSDQVTWINVSAPTTIPAANFTANGGYTTVAGTAPLTVVFNYPQTNGSTSWSWIFGDGNTTGNTDQNPTHLYTASGTYSVNHSATNVIGIGWKNVSSMIVVTNATGFTPQDIWMEGQYLQTFHITDSSTGLPIPVVDLQDTAMQTYTTTNGTGYLTEAFGSSSVTFVSSGYDSRAISYFFDSDATWDVQMTLASPNPVPNTNIIWSPSSVAIQILDANYVPILGDPVYITAYSSSLPGGLSGAVEYFKSAYGVSDSVAQSMFAANTTYYGTTDDNGFISAQVVSIIQYQIITHDTNGNNVTRLMWPAGAYYQIVTENATVAGIAAQGRAQSSIYKNSTFNTTFWEPNSTYSCMGINVYDSTGATTNVSAWWKLVDNGTVWWTNSTSIGGYGPINSSRCVPHVPYQQWKWGGITD